MSTREEAIRHINQIYDLTEAEGREVIGLGCAIVHSGPRVGLDHVTTEVRTLAIHAPCVATPLLGGIEILWARVMDHVTYTAEPLS